MKVTQYQVDAFASRVFEGNPAAVCPLDHWLNDKLLQSIAEENNLSETAFFVPSHKGFKLHCVEMRRVLTHNYESVIYRDITQLLSVSL